MPITPIAELEKIIGLIGHIWYLKIIDHTKVYNEFKTIHPLKVLTIY